jgi:hypothetical protein
VPALHALTELSFCVSYSRRLHPRAPTLVASHSFIVRPRLITPSLILDLTKSNWVEWSCHLTLLADRLLVFGHLNGTLARPDPAVDPTAHQIWDEMTDPFVHSSWSALPPTSSNIPYISHRLRGTSYMPRKVGLATPRSTYSSRVSASSMNPLHPGP